MRKILIIEDDPNIREILTTALSIEDFLCMEAEDGSEGAHKALSDSYDLILLDLMLPGMDGFEVLQTMRRNGVTTPVIILTAKSDETDKIIGLGFGADDYITKPFSVRELSARVKATIRRNELVKSPQTGDEPVPKVIRIGEIEIDAARHDVRIADRHIALTLKEFELLKTLAENSGRILTRAQLLDKVWGYEYSGETRTVDVHVRYLRKKLGKEIISTIRGLGYRIG